MQSVEALCEMMEANLAEIEMQIDALKRRTNEDIYTHKHLEGLTVYDIQQSGGRPVLSDLLIAKTYALTAMASLKIAASNDSHESHGS